MSLSTHTSGGLSVDTKTAPQSHCRSRCPIRLVGPTPCRRNLEGLVGRSGGSGSRSSSAVDSQVSTIIGHDINVTRDYYCALYLCLHLIDYDCSGLNISA